MIYLGNWRRIKNKFIHSSFNNYFFFQIKSWCKEEMEKAEHDQATELKNLIQTHLEKCGFWMKASPTKMDYINCHVFLRKNRLNKTVSYSLSPSKLNVLLIDMLNTFGNIVWSLYRDDATVFLVKNAILRHAHKKSASTKRP